MAGATRADYGPTREHGAFGGIVSCVEQGSPADRAGISPGQRITHADGMAVRDVLDWRWIADSASVTVRLTTLPGDEHREVVMTRSGAEAWGVEFSDILFDGVRTCANRCTFCFMTQLPSGLRPSLYVRDDDFRLSFLQGNFISLTNLSDADVERVAEQSLSPLYVSLHAVTPEVRSKLVCAASDRALERFDQLVEAGIDLHVQIVLVPGVNDGAELDTTLTWLAEREGVSSVGVVPLGFTRHQSVFTHSYNEPLAAATVIQQVQRWQFAMRERDGVTWVHLADEFYLNAGAPFPSLEWYDDYPQYENGIGVVRSFASEALELRAEIEAAVAGLPADAERVTLVTSVMSATTLAGALDACGAVGRVRLLVVPNRFFGGNVSVTGLLTGEDLIAAISGDVSGLSRPTVYLVPDIVLNADRVTLDDIPAEGLGAHAGADVRVVSSDVRGLLDGLLSVASRPFPETEE
ncbi:MAG: DUF512 domain-containing protein [Coriobacteriia bacterium]|nr:DUF512 domain-containing protein [Coriobacteriia bacterium]